MKWSRWLEHPPLLTLLTLVFALIPAGLAVVTYRDARQKDQRLHETTAEMLTEQLQRSTGSNSYYLTQLRQQARKLSDADLAAGKLTLLNFNWHERLPHLLSYGYAQRLPDGRVLVRWQSAPRSPSLAPSPAGDPELTHHARIAAALVWRPGADRIAILDCQPTADRLLVLCAVPPEDVTAPPRGYVFGWVNLASICRDPALPLIHDQILGVAALAPDSPAPDGARVVTIGAEPPRWRAAISRGPRFTERYGPPTPWLVFIAVGLSAVPLLVLAVLAGRASRLRADLATEREVARQQRFFTQSVSHEFRTPLGVILSGVELLETYSERLPPERRTEVISEIKTHLHHMNDLIAEVLLLGRLESGRLPFQPQAASPANLCRELARQTETATHRRNPIQVNAPDSEALLDGALLTAILGNLLANAVKYSPAGRPVALDVVRSGANLVFTVRDEGIGIPEADLPRVFDPFHRCANVGDTPGSGLGLAIVQRAVTLHGGTLALASRVGAGTTFTVTLPAALAPDSPSA
jgi:signal transduction histidine kinase